MTLITLCRSALAFTLIPALIFATVTPAHAFLGLLTDPTGPIQRALMIANQVTQISNQVAMLRELGESVTELQDQLTHMRDAALGQVGALTQPFRDLATVPTDLLSGSVRWAGDFTGDAAGLVNAMSTMGLTGGTSLTDYMRGELATADQVQETDVISLFPNPQQAQAAADAYLINRDLTDRQRVSDYAALTAAENLRALLETAQTSLDGLRGQTNTSTQALRQAQIAGMVTDGEIAVASAQLQAYQAAADALERQNTEIQRRRELTRWTAAEAQAQNTLATVTAATTARRQVYRDAALLPIQNGGGNN